MSVASPAADLGQLKSNLSLHQKKYDNPSDISESKGWITGTLLKGGVSIIDFLWTSAVDTYS